MAKKANPNKAIYIDVASSVYDVRKDILNVNMEVINLLKKYEYFKELRQNKQKGFAILKELMKDINNDFVKLKNDLPEIQPQREEKIKLKVEEKKFVIKHKKVNKEISSLDKEMNKLKWKLRSLS